MMKQQSDLRQIESPIFCCPRFSVFAFVELDRQSNVRREVMVKIMTANVSRRRSQTGARGDQGRASAPSHRDAESSHSSPRGGGIREACSNSPMDTSACIFWCAVGLGGLVQGGSVEAVVCSVRSARRCYCRHTPDCRRTVFATRVSTAARGVYSTYTLYSSLRIHSWSRSAAGNFSVVYARGVVAVVVGEVHVATRELIPIRPAGSRYGIANRGPLVCSTKG